MNPADMSPDQLEREHKAAQTSAQTDEGSEA